MFRFGQVALLVLLLMSLATMLYAGAYLGLSDRGGRIELGESMDLDNPKSYTITRTFDHAWMAWVFDPASWVESRLEGVEVEVGSWVEP